MINNGVINGVVLNGSFAVKNTPTFGIFKVSASIGSNDTISLKLQLNEVSGLISNINYIGEVINITNISVGMGHTSNLNILESMAFEGVQSISVGFKDSSEQGFVLFSPYSYQGISVNKNSIITNSLFTFPISIVGNSGYESLKNSFNPSVQSHFDIKGSIALKTYQGVQNYKLNIEQNIIGILELKTDITYDQIPNLINEPYNIYLDGASIKDQIISSEITISEANVHNSITINSNDITLYNNANPKSNSGVPRLVVQLKNREMHFLLESREGSEKSFTLWGRDPSAKLNTPHSDELGYSVSSNYDTAQAASQIANDLANGQVVIDWLVEDWAVPLTFEYTGTPIDGIKKLANEIGGVLRANDDGSLTVRYKYPTAPIDMSHASYVTEYNRELSLIEQSYKEGIGSHVIYVDVEGYTPKEAEVIVEVDPSPDNVLNKGEITYVYVYPENKQIKSSDFTVFTTAGNVSEGKFNEILEPEYSDPKGELITFIDGAASTKYPIQNLLSVDWVGSGSGTPKFTKWTRNLILDTPDNLVAWVRYKTLRDEFIIYDHYVDRLIFILIVENNGIHVKIETQDIYNKSSDDTIYITAPLLTTESGAINRGLTELYNEKYDYITTTISVPFNPYVRDGSNVFINNSKLGIIDNCKVIEASIIFEGPKVTNNLQVIQWPL